MLYLHEIHKVVPHNDHLDSWKPSVDVGQHSTDVALDGVHHSLCLIMGIITQNIISSYNFL